MTLPQLILLFVAGILSGIVGTVAGLASLVSYPALLLAGLPPVTANISNTIALVANGAGAVLGSQQELRGQGKRLRQFLPFTIAGGLAGGLILIAAPSTSFEHIVPFFIVGAALVVLFPNQVRAIPKMFQHRRESEEALPQGTPSTGGKGRLALLLLGIFITGIYGGYFGAASGVIMMALLTTVLDTPFTVTNALKNTLGEAANTVAAILFLFTSPTRWAAIIPLAIGMFVGGYIGPRIFRRLNPVFLRWLIGGLAVLLAVVLFIQAY